MRVSNLIITLALLIAVMVATVPQTQAVPPTPEAIEKWKAEGVWEQTVADWHAFKAAGGNSPEEYVPFKQQRMSNRMSLDVQTTDTVHVVVILVDFSDHHWYDQGAAGTPVLFDSILFSDRELDIAHNPTGSMTDYYMENSYGTFYIKGDIFGWYEMPSPYSYYVGNDNGLTNGRLLARDAVNTAEADGVDFSKYDSDGDGYCDGMVIIHAGQGAETGAYGIWSHKSNIYPSLNYDGVTISVYTMNPEEYGNQRLSPIGVFCHEYGHVMGLPDLYDIDYEPETSNGLGDWTIMATGSYNGEAKTPAHFDGWCKSQMGFISLIDIEENIYQAEIPCVEYNPVAYRLRNDRSGSYEYWVVENRQRVGFDIGLPGAGLCIFHVDMLAPNHNTNYLRYRVAMEQADGENALALAGSNGDTGDPWPGSTNNRHFHDLSIPNSRTNDSGLTHGATTRVGVWNISNSDSVMYADLDIDWSRPWVYLTTGDSILFDDSPPGGDGDGLLEPSETIKFYCTVTNRMHLSYNVRAILSTNNPEVTFTINEVPLASVLDDTHHSNMVPIEFRLNSAFVPVIDSFYLTITGDSTASAVPGSDLYSTTFGFDVNIGPPQVLIVDDDRGEDYEQAYAGVLYDLQIPWAVWHKNTQGSPPGTELAKYPIVFWHTGDSAENVLNLNDIEAMKYYFDRGGNILLSTITGAIDINSLDPDFMSDYLGASLNGTSFCPRFSGVDGNPISDGAKYTYQADAPNEPQQILTPTNNGEAAITFLISDDICGVTYQGIHSAVFLTFPVEYLADNYTDQGFATRKILISAVIEMFGGIPTGVDDGRRYAPLPRNFDLCQNYPNPFNPTTTISYTVRPTTSVLPKINLTIYNMLGQKVITLVDKVQLPGEHSVIWNSTNSDNQPVSTGVYFYRLTRGNDSESKKMILLK